MLATRPAGLLNAAGLRGRIENRPRPATLAGRLFLAPPARPQLLAPTYQQKRSDTSGRRAPARGSPAGRPAGSFRTDPVWLGRRSLPLLPPASMPRTELPSPARRARTV